MACTWADTCAESMTAAWTTGWVFGAEASSRYEETGETAINAIIIARCIATERINGRLNFEFEEGHALFFIYFTFRLLNKFLWINIKRPAYFISHFNTI